MKKLFILVFLVSLLFSCGEKEPVIPIPHATTPVACDAGSYFAKFNPAYQGNRLIVTDGSHLLVVDESRRTVVKIDAIGNKLAEKTLGVRTTSGFLFRKQGSGYFTHYPVGVYDFVFGVCDENLNFSKTLTVSLPLSATHELIEIGHMGSAITIQDQPPRVIFIDSNANKLWEYAYPSWPSGKYQIGFNEDRFLFADGYFYMSTMRKQELSSSEIHVTITMAKLDMGANEQWRKEYDVVDSNAVMTFVNHIRMEQGKLIVNAELEHRVSKEGSHADIIIDAATGAMGSYTKTDKAFGDTVNPHLPIQLYTADAQYILDEMGGSIVMVKKDLAGNKLWEKRYRNVSGQSLNDAVMLHDAIYLLSNTYYFDGKNPGQQSKFTLMKTDKDGNMCY